MSLDVYDERPDETTRGARPHIGVRFECCGVYARVYRRPEQRVYEGRCPKCLRPLRVRVGADGVPTRLFCAS